MSTGGGEQVTVHLYQNKGTVKPLLNRLDIRLGFILAKDLTVPAKNFGLKRLRERLAARDAEGRSRALTVLQQAITDNQKVLKTKGYPASELEVLAELHAAIDADNATQNSTLNTNTAATVGEDADYLALNALLGKIMRTGRLLYKVTKQKRQQYEVAAIGKRVHAAQHPGEAPRAALTLSAFSRRPLSRFPPNRGAALLFYIATHYESYP